MSPPQISAIVLNYRSPKDTVRCVRALLHQTIIDRMEILIVDNHSDDDSIGTLRAKFADNPQIHIIETHNNIGFGRGNMEGNERANGKYLLILNPDNTLKNDTIEQMVEILEKNPDIGIVGPQLVHPDGSIRPSARPFPTFHDLLMKRFRNSTWKKRHQTYLSDTQEKLIDVDWIAGACVLMPKSLFDATGGFDPRFFLFFEDADLCRRIHQMGKRVVYAPYVKVADKAERLSGKSMFSILTRKTARVHAVSAIKYFNKWR